MTSPRLAGTNRLALIDLPRRCDGELYGRTIDRVVSGLSSMDFVDSIYQVGSVGHPGISDIDLLVVVDDAATSHADPLEGLAEEERYLFTHSCFLIPTSLAPELGTYALMHGYRRLHGTAWNWRESSGDLETTTALRVQTALEFLAKNLLDLYVQIEYRVVKVRVLLQHVKALQLDLALLQVQDDRLQRVLESAMALIDEWFHREDADQSVAELATDLLPALRHVVVDATATHVLYSPSEIAAFSKNATIVRAPVLALSRHGIRLPRIPGLKERRYFNVQHRFNRFRFRLPITGAPVTSYQERRFEYLRRAKSFASARFPAYAAPIPPLFYRAL